MIYRKKPVEIEAFRFGHEDEPVWFTTSVVGVIINDVPTPYSEALYKDYERTPVFCNLYIPREEREYCLIDTLEGQMKAMNGDYIIKGVDGELYPCKPDIFMQTYERVYGDCQWIHLF